MEGYTRKRGNSWRIEISLGIGPDGKRLRYTETLSVKTKAEADDHLREKLREFTHDGAIKRRSKHTLETYLRSWLRATAKDRLRPKTFEGYADTLERHVFGSKLGNQPLSSVTRVNIKEHYASVREKIAKEKGTSGATLIRNLHAVLRAALNDAVEDKEINENPASGLKLPAVTRKERVVLRPEEFPVFMAAALQEERNGPLWVLLLATGCRPEEALGLRWPDISWRACEISIARALVRPMKVKKDEPAWRFEEVKTDRGRRFIAIDEQVMFLLRRHQADQAEEKLQAGAAYEDNGLVFANEIGRPLHQHNLSQRVFPRILKRAGLSLDLTPYGLRHSCATGLLEMGEDIGQVSNMLGHAKCAFTFDTYVARRPLRGAASKMGEALFGLNHADEKFGRQSVAKKRQ